LKWRCRPNEPAGTQRHLGRRQVRRCIDRAPQSVREPTRWGTWWVALTAAWLVTAILLMLGSRLGAVLGARGMIAIERLMGMILVAVAVQMFLSGVTEFRI